LERRATRPVRDARAMGLGLAYFAEQLVNVLLGVEREPALRARREAVQEVDAVDNDRVSLSALVKSRSLPNRVAIPYGSPRARLRQ
jgi:hypothetical protein